MTIFSLDPVLFPNNSASDFIVETALTDPQIKESIYNPRLAELLFIFDPELKSTTKVIESLPEEKDKIQNIIRVLYAAEQMLTIPQKYFLQRDKLKIFSSLLEITAGNLNKKEKGSITNAWGFVLTTAFAKITKFRYSEVYQQISKRYKIDEELLSKAF